MSGTAYNWDIDALIQMGAEILKLRDVLKENKDLLASEGFELLKDWKGKAGTAIKLLTVSDAESLENLIKRLTQLSDRLGDIVTKCYEPCESEIKASVSKLL